MTRSGFAHEEAADSPTHFASTHWSAVFRAGRASEPEARLALERLYTTYAAPLYRYVRRQGHSPETAQEIVQDLFVVLVTKNQLALVAPEKGRFRSYLLACVNHLLANEWHKGQRLKRGGGERPLAWDALAEEDRLALEPIHNLTPETEYERRWALTLMETVFTRLRQEWQALGKAHVFDGLRQYLTGDHEGPGYATTAAELGLSEGAARVAVHRLRARFRDLVHSEIAATVTTPAEIQEEWQHLVAVLRRV